MVSQEHCCGTDAFLALKQQRQTTEGTKSTYSGRSMTNHSCDRSSAEFTKDTNVYGTDDLSEYRQGSFPKKEVWEPNSGGSRISKWGYKVPKALRGVGCGEGVSPSPPPPHWGGIWGGGCLPRKKNLILISNRRTLVQTGCFLYSPPKAGAVLVRHTPKCQTLAICMPRINLQLREGGDRV